MSVSSRPDPIQRLRHLVGGRVADEQRHQREPAEHPLQERQLHFERVLLGMRECASVDVRQGLERRQCGRVERHFAQRRREAVSAGVARPRTATRWAGPISTTREM